MTRRATKILTVMTLATAAVPALADNPRPTVPARWEADGVGKIGVVVLAGAPYMVTAGTAPVPLTWREYGRYLGETGPLVGPDGRPGCGNTLGKGESKCETARTAASEARKAAALAKSAK